MAKKRYCTVGITLSLSFSPSPPPPKLQRFSRHFSLTVRPYRSPRTTVHGQAVVTQATVEVTVNSALVPPPKTAWHHDHTTPTMREELIPSHVAIAELSVSIPYDGLATHGKLCRCRAGAYYNNTIQRSWPKNSCPPTPWQQKYTNVDTRIDTSFRVYGTQEYSKLCASCMIACEQS